MDYSKFLDESFDVKEWVNAAFRANKDSSQDQYATTLVMKLQMFIQEVNNLIEESCLQSVNNLPRVMRELEALKQEAVLLQDQMKMIKFDIQKVEQDTSQSMLTLLKLDTVKTRMKDASEALQEADNWTSLLSGLDDIYESGNVNEIAAKLVGLQQSLLILTDVPDYEERCQYLETLKNRLEALLSPQVVAAFSAHSLESAQMYVKIFTDIDRLPQLYKYYHKCHRVSLLQQWRDENRKSLEFPVLLSTFYDHLLSVCSEQVSWCSQVFAEPMGIVCELFTETLVSLEPGLPSCIQRHLEESEGVALNKLIALKKISERFANNMESALVNHSNAALTSKDVGHLAVAIYAPYQTYILQYGFLESEFLSASLDSIQLDHEEVLDSVNLLAESVGKVFSTAKQAQDRCLEFTNGCGFIMLPSTFASFFSAYVKEFRRVVVNIGEKCRVELPSFDYQDWVSFQNILKIIHTCGDLIMHTDELEHSLVSAVVGSVGKICFTESPEYAVYHNYMRQSKPSPFHDFGHLLLDKQSDREKLNDLLEQLESGKHQISLLKDVYSEMYSLSASLHQFAFDVVFAPLQQLLMSLPDFEIWQSESQAGAITTNLPAFGLTPQEYITKIGQYLMTLPQQLEPFTQEDNPALCVALKHGRLPHTLDQTDMPEQLADLWLESVANGSMRLYAEQILNIPKLSTLATQQLLIDIDYFCNVMDDLGLSSLENICNIAALLKASPEEYTHLSDSVPLRLQNRIAAIRNLSLH
ncbi:hypothetical protein CAPTEDRAFT_161050 [Capitella teleta]|uniref:Conserved oligomeric Golgi complex subunit 7 n=1 Tax=Capitella teleta TaxID=283909 RepID=R7T9M2_CAPTE|nr:hypothetical protein CAPTEDRAFT_161050 [Capitella teleta]|eukprot:ELT88100.1 hypothetical protein CAPTEDRAFT_161050 [Capitella teleta]